MNSIEPGHSRVSTNHDNNAYQSRNNREAYSPMRNNRKLHTIIDIPRRNLKNDNSLHYHHDKKMSLFTNDNKSRNNTI